MPGQTVKVEVGGQIIEVDPETLTLAPSTPEQQQAGMGPTLGDRALGALPEAVGQGVGLATRRSPGLNVVAPAMAAGAATMMRDAIDPKTDVSLVRAGEHALANAIPGAAGAAMRIPGAARMAVSSLRANPSGVLVGLLDALTKGAPKAASTAAAAAPAATAAATPALDNTMRSATLPDGTKLLSPQGLQQLVKLSVQLENTPGSNPAQIQALDVLIDRVRNQLSKTAGAAPSARQLLSQLGQPITTAATRAASATSQGVGQTVQQGIKKVSDPIANIVDALRAILTGGSAATAGPRE